MPKNFLGLCQQLIRDAGISGDLTTVTSQKGEFKRVIDWVKRATTAVETTWFNWDFMHVFHTFDTIIGVRDYSPPSDHNYWDNRTAQIPSREQTLGFMQWTQKKLDPTQAFDGDPHSFTILPDKTIRLYDTPTSILTINIEYWMLSDEMSKNTDIPLIPEHYRDIIVAKALQYYANYESADEAKIQAAEEFKLRMLQLEASELPAHQASSAVNNGVDIQVQVPFDQGFFGDGFNY